ncbi:hypothetical protein KQX54_000056, partial [Cotesia glomerata]
MTVTTAEITPVIATIEDHMVIITTSIMIKPVEDIKVTTGDKKEAKITRTEEVRDSNNLKIAEEMDQWAHCINSNHGNRINDHPEISSNNIESQYQTATKTATTSETVAATTATETASAELLTDLVKKDTSFVWKGAQKNSSKTLKGELCEGFTLQFPDFRKPFIVTTDALEFA